MSKKVKLNLENLEVQSFVTSLEDDEKKAVKGGASYLSWCMECTEDRFCY